MRPKDADGIENSVDPGSTLLEEQEQSDLGLHCLLRSACPKIWDHYGIQDLITVFYCVSIALWQNSKWCRPGSGEVWSESARGCEQCYINHCCSWKDSIKPSLLCTYQCFPQEGVQRNYPRELDNFENLWSSSLPMSHKCVSKIPWMCLKLYT